MHMSRKRVNIIVPGANIPIVNKVFLNNVQFTCSLPVQEVRLSKAIIELLQNQVEFESLGEILPEFFQLGKNRGLFIRIDLFSIFYIRMDGQRNCESI